tara:strand:- start:152 stop:445 length:294 start_codon:yes stop_codon:yes gene_type:complete
MVVSTIKKTNINKKKHANIKFKLNQSPTELIAYVESLKGFLKQKDSFKFALIDEILKIFEHKPRNLKALVKQLDIYSRLIECQKKKDGLKQVKQRTV